MSNLLPDQEQQVIEALTSGDPMGDLMSEAALSFHER